MWPVTGGIVQTDSNRRYCAARGWYVRAAVTKCLGAAAIAMLTGFCSLMSIVTERGRRVRDHAVSNGGWGWFVRSLGQNWVSDRK